MPYVIQQDLCSCCHQCRVECPVQAITFRNTKYWIDPDKCVSCGRCARVCHNGCISNPDRPEPAAEPHAPVHKTCDVCVIGAGAAGMVAAAKCADAGQKVIVLEKMHEVGGSAWYASGFTCHWSQWHEQAGLQDNRRAEYENFLKMVDNDVDPDLLWRMFEANQEFVDWLIDEHDFGKDWKLSMSPMGARIAGTWEWERAGTRIDKMIGPGEGGWYITTHLRDSILAAGGEILYKTPAVQLLTDGAGTVCGVVAEDAGGQVEIACKSVVIATGAFTRSRKWMDKMQPMFHDDAGKEPIHIFTAAGCTGDGLTMCDAIGADIDYEHRRVNMFGPMRHPYPCVSLSVALGSSGQQFWTTGEPFENSPGMSEVSPLVNDPKWFIWKVVDDAIAEEAVQDAIAEPPQSPGMDLGKFLVNWREVLEEEEIAGGLVSAPTLEELADKLGFDRAEFLQNIAAYNQSTAEPPKADPNPGPFGPQKPKKPIEKGPFYALKLKMFHENAIGGMVIDKHASVLKNGTPIPGLYAAGDTTRGIMIAGDVGVGYIERVFSALTQAFNEGYIAGVEAAAHAAAV